MQGPDALDRRAHRRRRSGGRCGRSRRAVKTQLLSQRPMAGVGNIYADEALWRARIHPARRTVTRAQAAALLDALREVLAGSLRYGGTTLSDYRTVEGARAATSSGSTCTARPACRARGAAPSCGRARSTAGPPTWCPTCQPR